MDASGRVVAKYFEEDYTQRFTASDILIRQFGAAAGAAHTSTETKHLRLSASASSDRVRGGQRIALTLDIEMKPKMHVYAPGVENYIPIDWTITPQEVVTLHPMTAPPSKRLRLEAIDETVPVYEGHLRLVREITLGRENKLRAIAPNGELTIEGTFRYQACDDRMCYVPQTVPLKWTLRVEKHDTERPPAPLQKKLGD